ncbi:MAG: glycosyltransferase [Solirubrobacterales bacterium]
MLWEYHASVRTESEIAVVIPAHHAGATIDGCLEGLHRQTHAADRFEVHVVDTGEDDTAEVVARRASSWDRLHYHRAERRGPGAQRNLGASRAGEVPYLAFIDADCVPEEDWLTAGVRRLDQGAQIVQGPTLAPEGEPSRAFAHSIAVSGPSPLFEGCNVMYAAPAFRDAGGFPVEPFERVGAPFGEDTELAWHVLRAGGRVAFAPDAVVRHLILPQSFAAHLRYQWQIRHIPWLIRRVPELRREALTAGLFLGRRSLRFDAAVAGLILARRGRVAGLLALPYASWLLSKAHGGPRIGAARVSRHLASDSVRAAALVWGSLVSRQPVL